MSKQLAFTPIRYAARVAVSENKGAIIGVLSISILITIVCNLLLNLVGTGSFLQTDTLLSAGTAAIDAGATAVLYREVAVIGLISLFTTLISAPISMGLYAVLANAINKKPATVGTALSFYSNGQKLRASVFGLLYYSIITLGWMLAFILPATFFIFAGTVIFTIAVLMAGIFAAIFITARMPGLFILARDPSTSIFQAFRTAKQLMKPYMWNFFLLELSYSIIIGLITGVLNFFLAGQGLALVAQVISWIISAYISMKMYAAMIAYFQQVETLSLPGDTNL